MIDKNKIEEIEYYTYLESIIDNLDISINKISTLEKKNKRLKYSLIYIYILLIIFLIINIILIVLLIK